MKLPDKMKREARKVFAATLYFAAWFLAMVALKTLILAEHGVEYSGIFKALFGALVVGKVVLVLEHVPLGRWIRKQPAWFDVVLRTLLYAAGIFVVLGFEKAFKERHEAGGFGASLVGVFDRSNAYHVWAKTICVSEALFVFNAIAVLRRRLGFATLIGFFTTPLPEEPKTVS